MHTKSPQGQNDNICYFFRPPCFHKKNLNPYITSFSICTVRLRVCLFPQEGKKVYFENFIIILVKSSTYNSCLYSTCTQSITIY